MQKLIYTVGLPASGKCLKQDSLIPTKAGLLYFYEIGQGSSNGWNDTPPITVKDINGDDRACKKVYKEEVGSLIKIKTSLGTVIECTPEHPILTLFFNEEMIDAFEYKKAKDIKEGDVVPVVRKEGVFSTVNPLITFSHNRAKKDYSSNDIVVPDNNDIDISSILGYLVANGSTSQTNFQFTSYNKDAQNDFCKKVSKITNHYSVKKDGVVVNSVQFVKFIESLCGEGWKTARHKSIPNFVRRATKKHQMAFLSFLFDCDSSVDINKGCFEYSTASEKLAKEIHAMLLNFGIINTVSPKFVEEYNHVYWRVCIYGEFFNNFLDIYCGLKYRDIEKREVKDVNIDLIYGFHDFLYQNAVFLKKSLGVNKAGMYKKNEKYERFKLIKWGMRHGNDRDFTYKSLKRFLDNYQIGEYVDFDKYHGLAKQIYDLNYFYTKVSDIKMVNEKTTVYDLSVPESHSFVCNGMINHNSTWSKKKILDSQGHFKRINKDDLREMVDAGKWTKGNEKFILKLRDLMIEEALCQGYSVIVDDTNFAPKHKEAFNEMAKTLNELGLNIKVEEQFFDVDVETCIERDLKRQRSVGEKVIREMYNRYLRPDYNPQRNVDNYVEGLPNAIICDLDGTLCLYDDSGLKARHYDRDFINDKPNRVVLDLLKRYPDHKLIIFSGRNGKYEKETKQWLDKHNVKYDIFAMRKENDKRKDTEVKLDFYNEFVKDKFNISFVCDDRKCVIELWQSLGLYVLDVGRGLVY